jgi:hypothetical protein
MGFEMTAVEGSEADGLLQYAFVNGLVIDVRESAFVITDFRAACDLRSYAFEQVLLFQESRNHPGADKKWAPGL